MAALFGSFSPPRRIRSDDGSVSGDRTLAGPMPGAIERLLPDNRYRADIRLFSGTKLAGVRLPGPRYDRKGNLHGIKPGYHKGQMVLVAYAGGAASPIVVETYPFAADDLEKGNLKGADYNPDTVEIGHGSGHKATFAEDKLTIGTGEVDSMVVDYEQDRIQLQARQLLLYGDQLQLGNGAILGAAYGAPIYAYLQAVNTYLAQVSAFLSTVIPVTGAPAPWAGGPPPAPPDENMVVSEATKII